MEFKNVEFLEINQLGQAGALPYIVIWPHFNIDSFGRAIAHINEEQNIDPLANEAPSL